MYGGSGNRLGDGYDRAPSGGVEGDNCHLQLGIGGCLVCLLLVIGVAVSSLGTVPLLFYGMRYNSFNKAAATDSVYEPGRHFIGPMNSFLLFSSVAQNIEFISDPNLRRYGLRYDSLTTRTKEGFSLKLQVSFQYRLQQENIGKLYQKFNQRYEDVFISVARDTLIKAASQYNAVQLWTERDQFAATMQTMIDTELKKIWADCWSLQLTIIDLPDDFEETLTKTQVQEQAMLVREQEQISTKIRAETSVIEASYAKKVKVLLAGGQANFTVLTQEAEAKARQTRIGVESGVLKIIKEAMGFDAGSLVAYQRFNAMDELSNASILYGFSGAQQLLVRS